MCYGCYEDYGFPTCVSPAVLDAAAKMDACDPFGDLHVVIDDWNIEDEHIEWCRAKPGLIPLDRAAIDALAALTLDERAAAMAIRDGYLLPDGTRHPDWV